MFHRIISCLSVEKQERNEMKKNLKEAETSEAILVSEEQKHETACTDPLDTARSVTRMK